MLKLHGWNQSRVIDPYGLELVIKVAGTILQ